VSASYFASPGTAFTESRVREGFLDCCIGKFRAKAGKLARLQLLHFQWNNGLINGRSRQDRQRLAEINRRWWFSATLSVEVNMLDSAANEQDCDNETSKIRKPRSPPGLALGTTLSLNSNHKPLSLGVKNFENNELCRVTAEGEGVEP
jgi:hypothetical protein